ncbi:hypothetical protein H5410_038663 [Solanum commersonii]|uniref:Uncharacterized protein n=1 Tax=Solanum commersonii TaxID=4109 RepID=A0A9J5YC06_SOLCO|nr:hypothetical protein H5410_038663 [Solanum commersonii]
MSLFQNWAICTDYFGVKLPSPLPTKEKKNANSTATKGGAATDNVGVGEINNGKNKALTITPFFDGFYETTEQEKEKKKAEFKYTKTVKSLSIGAAIANVLAGGSKKNSSKN